MKIINQSAVLLPELVNEQSFLGCERAARTCYASHDKSKGTLEAAIKMTNALANAGHTGCLEMGVLYLQINNDNWSEDVYKLINDSNVLLRFDDNNTFVYTNLATIRECVPSLYEYMKENKGDLRNNSEFKYFTPSNDDEYKYHQFEIVTERIQTQSITRYRKYASRCQESQRYVDLVMDGSDICYIKPHWFQNGTSNRKRIFKEDCVDNEKKYIRRRSVGLTPEDARGCLANEVASRMIESRPEVRWDYAVQQRVYDSTGKAHPQIKLLFEMIEKQLNEHKNG